MWDELTPISSSENRGSDTRAQRNQKTPFAKPFRNPELHSRGENSDLLHQITQIPSKTLPLREFRVRRNSQSPDIFFRSNSFYQFKLRVFRRCFTNLWNASCVEHKGTSIPLLNTRVQHLSPSINSYPRLLANATTYAELVVSWPCARRSSVEATIRDFVLKWGRPCPDSHPTSVTEMQGQIGSRGRVTAGR